MRLQDIKTVYICPNHNEKYKKRKEYMDALLTKLGFKDFTHFQSGTEDYPACLSKATQTLLKQYMDIPILILEDDLEFTGNDTFDWDVSADAIYFGLSQFGGDDPYKHGESIVKPYNNTMVKVYSMYATHAILYISPEYNQAVINTLSDVSQANDVVIARLHKKFNILAMKKPAFWQSAVFNPGVNVEKWTKFEFETTIHKVYF